MRMLIMGAPGAGKGTQATLLSEKLGVPHISTGDLFRHNISNGTPLGVEAKKYLDAGDLVPASLTNALVDDRIDHDDAAGGFILDGFPRSTEQADALHRRGLMFILSSPSGAGKTTISRMLLDADEEIKLSVSVTTRPPRPGEIDLHLALGDAQRVAARRQGAALRGHRLDLRPQRDFGLQKPVARRAIGLALVGIVEIRHRGLPSE